MAASLPLSRYTVLVTRPLEQSQGLCQAIADLGGEAVVFPALAIEACADAAAAARLMRIDDYDWAIFISANAVRYAQIAADNGIIPPISTVRIAAIGAATAAALNEAGITPQLVPGEPGDSEALAAMDELQQVSGRRCLIVRGAGGREWLADTLRERGALVEYAEVYRRVKPNADAGPLLQRWRQGQIHAVLVSSGETLSNLAAMIGFEGLALLCKTPLVTVSERVREQALAMGVRRACSAAGASDAALVNAVTVLLTGTASELTPSRESPIVTDQDTPSTGHGAQTAPAPTHAATPEPTPPATAVTAPPSPAADAASPNPAPAAQTAQTAPRPADAPTPATGGGKKAKDKPIKPPRRSWIGYAVLLGVAVIATGGYFLIQQIRSTQEGLGGELSKEDQAIAGLQSRFDIMHNQVVALETRLDGMDTKLEQGLREHGSRLEEKLTQTQSAMQADLQGLHRLLGKTRSDWLVADAEYLLGAALQRLHLVGDIKTAIAALEGADERLREAGDPAVFKVREQLANEIRILNSFTPPDLIGASSRLLALQAKVKELPLYLPHAGKTISPGTHAATPATPSDAAPLVDEALGELEKIVVIRRLNKPVNAVLTPEETLVLREMLLLKLETARMALIRGDEALYKNSLASARTWLAENFDTSQAAVRSVDGDIKALMEQSIQINYPELGKSLAMLRDITKLRVETDGAVQNQPRGKAPPPAAEAAPAQDEKGAPAP